MVQDAVAAQRQQQTQKRRTMSRKRASAAKQQQDNGPPPVEGRQHIEVQTELYLEEISDRVVESDVQTQTDPFLDRPPSPLFIPPKTGIDVATQIEEGEVTVIDWLKRLVDVSASLVV